MRFQGSYCITEIGCGSAPGVECVGQRHTHILSSSDFLEDGQARQNEQLYQVTATK